MQGNVGGGSSVIFMGGGGNDEGKAIAGGIVIAGLVVWGIGYTIAWNADESERQALTDQFLANSVAHCANITADEAGYTSGLRDEFMNVWSSELQATQDANPRLVICTDDALNGFTLPFDYNDSVKRIWGENRVMGILYTDAYGDQAMVFRPQSDTVPFNTIDDKPDKPFNFSKVLENINNIPDDAHQYTLPDGTSVSVFFQRDAITQEFGSDRIPDDDGQGWANAEIMEEILQHYELNWPLVRSTGVSYTPSI